MSVVAQRVQPPSPVSGTCLVAGFGAGLFEDLARVEAHRPGLPIIAVNGAAAHVPAFSIFSLHWEPEKLGQWAIQQREAFGEGFTVHACGKPEWEYHNRINYPYVDHWWDGVISRGSSGWAAARLALAMGFDEVVLCGVPMDRCKYADGNLAVMFQSSLTSSLSVFRKAIELDTVTRTRCFSMSGWTADLLGLPPFLRETGDARQEAPALQKA